jgi:hypothetical protein
MTLETAIAELTEALKVNSTLLTQANTGRVEAMDLLSVNTRGATAKQAAEPSAEKKRGRPAKSAAMPAVPTVEDVRAVFGDYMRVDDAAERDRRGARVKAILGEIGAMRATEIPEIQRAQAIRWVNDLKAGKSLSFIAEEDEAESLL